jgi:hypothetical protein
LVLSPADNQFNSCELSVDTIHRGSVGGFVPTGLSVIGGLHGVSSDPQTTVNFSDEEPSAQVDTRKVSYKEALSRTPLQVFNKVEEDKLQGDRSNITIRKKPTMKVTKKRIQELLREV